MDVAPTAVFGKRDVVLRTLGSAGSALRFTTRSTTSRSRPRLRMSRLGSDVHPKGYQQFEAVGYHRGADGKPHTADDVRTRVRST